MWQQQQHFFSLSFLRMLFWRPASAEPTTFHFAHAFFLCGQSFLLFNALA
jgi:hypothetical protein